jgi:hypothetical protein
MSCQTASATVLAGAFVRAKLLRIHVLVPACINERPCKSFCLRSLCNCQRANGLIISSFAAVRPSKCLPPSITSLRLDFWFIGRQCILFPALWTVCLFLSRQIHSISNYSESRCSSSDLQWSCSLAPRLPWPRMVKSCTLQLVLLLTYCSRQSCPGSDHSDRGRCCSSHLHVHTVCHQHNHGTWMPPRHSKLSCTPQCSSCYCYTSILYDSMSSNDDISTFEPIQYHCVVHHASRYA